MRDRANFALPRALAICMFAALRTASGDEPTDGAELRTEADYLHEVYLGEAEQHEFYRDARRQTPLKLVERPIMRWTSDGGWSGEVYVWTHAGRPEVVGCMLSSPGAGGLRNLLHEFHLIADKPIAPAELRTRRRWAPEQGLKTAPVVDAPAPAETASRRLTQMRNISRGFIARMQGDSVSELRLLPQPLYRYGDERTEILDGALFAYVSTKGTDPELILLVECSRAGSEIAWRYAPVRSTTRELRLEYAGREVWRVEAHYERAGDATSSLYTISGGRSIPGRDPPHDAEPALTEEEEVRTR